LARDWAVLPEQMTTSNGNRDIDIVSLTDELAGAGSSPLTGQGY